MLNFLCSRGRCCGLFLLFIFNLMSVTIQTMNPQCGQCCLSVQLTFVATWWHCCSPVLIWIKHKTITDLKEVNCTCSLYRHTNVFLLSAHNNNNNNNDNSNTTTNDNNFLAHFKALKNNVTLQHKTNKDSNKKDLKSWNNMIVNDMKLDGCS